MGSLSLCDRDEDLERMEGVQYLLSERRSADDSEDTISDENSTTSKQPMTVVSRGARRIDHGVFRKHLVSNIARSVLVLFVICSMVGGASAAASTAAANRKQGAYGKVKTHKESTLSQLSHVDEVFAALTLLYLKPLKSNLDTDYIRNNFPAEDLAFCDDILVKVSRSFAAVIQQLPSTMLVDILVFYLVLRALDTIEDDTTAFASNKIKVNHLLSFHKKALKNKKWSMEGVGAGDERRLLEEFPKAHRVYAALRPESRKVIEDITKRMAEGMAEFVGKDLGQGTVDIDQYNRYCHFVAGLVGEGLSRLFAASRLEDNSFGSEVFLSDQMGLFLQKTNIIRDYLEDYVDKRAFWPQSVWKKYSLSGDLGYFANQDDPLARVKARECLNELVTDALELVPDCLEYMAKLQCQEIFRFCAIPQVMAIATLDKCYANMDVFTGVVKIRKGLSCKLILRTNNLCEVHETFYNFAGSIMEQAHAQRRAGIMDPSYKRTVRVCEAIRSLTWEKTKRRRRAIVTRNAVSLLLSGSAIAMALYLEQPTPEQVKIQIGLAAAAAAVFVVGTWMAIPSSDLKPAKELEKALT